MSKQFTSLDQMVQHYTGMQPDLDRKALLPRVTTEVVQPPGQGPRHVVTDVIAPQALYELVKAYYAPAYAASGAYTSPEQAVDDAVNTALNVELGGGLASHAAGPVGPVIGMAVKQRDDSMSKRPKDTPRFMFAKDAKELGFAEGGPVHYDHAHIDQLTDQFIARHNG